MNRIIVLHTGVIAGGTARFEHGELQIHFHTWSGVEPLPLLEGSIWAFIDWELPGISGLEVCRRLRCNPLSAQTHITIIVPGDHPDSKRASIRAGADDYMIGPVDRSAILDRILSIELDELNVDGAHALELGELSVDIASYQARWQGKPIALMPNEFRLLRYLVEHPGRVFTRGQLIAALGKQEQPVDERTVDVWVGRLRRALRQAGNGEMLRTVRSLGYVLDKP